MRSRIVLTVALSEEEVTNDDVSTPSRGIGRVISSDVADYERFYLGMAQAYY